MHFRSLKGILFGLTHLPDSTDSLCDDTLNRLNAVLNLDILFFLDMVETEKLQ